MAHTGKKWRPKKADFEYVYDCACQGISVSQIIAGLSVDYKTFQKNLPFFSKALKSGKKHFDKHLDRVVPEVVNALIKKCTGYEYEEVSTKQKGKVVNGVLKDGDIERTVTKKWFPASDVAIIFFVTNRDKFNWQNSYNLNHTNDGKAFKNERWICQVVDPKTKDLCDKLMAGGGRESEKPTELQAPPTPSPDSK